MKLNPIQTVFRTAGLVTSLASAWGTYRYLMHETQGDLLLSGAAAISLSIAIFAGWDVVFNHKAWKRRALTAVIALTGAGVSTWTIYQHIRLPDVQAAESSQQQDEQEAQDQQDAERLRREKKAEEDRAAIKRQQDELKAERQQLETLNAQDRASITEREALIKKGIRPNGNTAAIKPIRADMALRQTRITEIQQLLLELTRQYTAIKVETASSSSQGGQESSTPGLVNELQTATLIRASLYEVMTCLFLLFGAFYRRNEDDVETEQVAQLQKATAKAKQQAERIFQLQDKLEATLKLAMTIGEQLNQQQQEAQAATETGNTQLAEIAQQAESLLKSVATESKGLQQLLLTSKQHRHQLPELLQCASAETEAMQSVVSVAKSLLEDLQTANVRCNKTIAGANAAYVGANVPANPTYAPANPPANIQTLKTAEKLTETEALQLLDKQEVEPSANGMITTDIIKDATGWGRTKAENLIAKAFDKGFLSRNEYGRGWTYFYPSKPTETDSINVVSIAGARS